MKRFGTIETLGKFDLINNDWRMPLSDEEKGKSLSIATYDIIKNNDNNEFNYIIIQRGTRLESLSKDYDKLKESDAYLDKIINYLKTRKNNYIIKYFLMDADAPLKEQALYLAKYIDNLSCDYNVKTINLLAFSKCGAVNFYVPKHFKNIESLKKTNIYTVASTFEANKLASPKIMYKDIKNIICSKLGDNKLSDLVFGKIISAYNWGNSNSHMDYDIALTEGISEEKQYLHDSSFIKDIFLQDNLTAISKVKSYKNFVTGIDEKTLNEAIRTGNLYGIGLCILDDVIFKKTSDGMVPISTQRLVESYIETKSYKLESAHHDVMSIKRIIDEICYVVDETINEQDEFDKGIKLKVKGQ